MTTETAHAIWSTSTTIQTPMEAAMSIPTASALATGKRRTHRMMRRTEQIRRMREHNRQADLAAVELMQVPFWRWRKRDSIADRMAHHRDRAAVYAETSGQGTTGTTNAQDRSGGVGTGKGGNMTRQNRHHARES